VVQESLLEAHRDFVQFRGRGVNEFLGWLRQILVNNLAHVTQRHVIAEKRDVRREVAIESMKASLEQSATRLAHVLAGEVVSPSSAAMHQEQLLALADALAELPDDYRQVIVLRHLEALPFREVAKRMDRSEGAVRMVWLRAMDRLRLAMRQDQ
jgi:RNA polymerase sigma-70 factor (ECF subfamily)